MNKTVYDLINSPGFSRRRGIRVVREFLNNNFYFILKMDLKSAQAETADCIAIWESSLIELQRIAAGVADIDTRPITQQNWRHWVGKNLRDIAPDDYVAMYEIPHAEAMLGRLEELQIILGFLAGKNPLPRRKK